MSLQVGRVLFDPRPHRCPVCHGVGTLPHDFSRGVLGAGGFYTQHGYASSTERVTCRSCDGQGVIWPPPSPGRGRGKPAEGQEP